MSDLDISYDLIRQIAEHQPESVVWVKPVWGFDSSGLEKIIDFSFEYCNPSAIEIAGTNLIGKKILQNNLPDPQAANMIFDQCLEVYNTGKPLEHTYYSDGLDKFLTLLRVKVEGGVLTTVRNRTLEYATQVEKEHQSRLLQSLIENSPYGISVYESVRNKEGEIIDFKPRLNNIKSSELTQLSIEILNTKTVQELIKLRNRQGYFELLKDIVESGEPKIFETFIPDRKQWLSMSIVKFEDGYLLNYMDITERKKFESEARTNAHELDTIFNGSLSGVYMAKAILNNQGVIEDLVFKRANESFYKMFAITPDLVIGKTLTSISISDQTPFLEFANDVLKTGEPCIQELEYHGPHRWFQFSMVKLDDETLSITVNDITDSKLSSLEIERQKNLLDNIMRQSPNGLSITQAIRDEKGEMVDARSVLMNDACEPLNGFPNQVMLDKTFGELTPELLESDLFRAAKQLKVGDSFRTEYYAPETDKWLELAVAKMDEDHYINVFIDISAVKKAQHELEITVEDLRKSNARLEEFAYAASHDLKEPIRKIQFFTNRLKEEYGEDMKSSTKTFFSRLELASARMDLLVDDLLQYSQVNQGAGEKEEVELNELIQNVLEDLDLVITEKGAKFSISSLPLVTANKRQMLQMFQNLLGNSIKYQKPGVPPEVKIEYGSIKGAEVKEDIPASSRILKFHSITIQDNGIGFDQKDAERIFDVFTRLHGNAEYKGTGVGLSIVQKVIQNHHGYIWAYSEPGQGARFKILLPQ